MVELMAEQSVARLVAYWAASMAAMSAAGRELGMAALSAEYWVEMKDTNLVAG